MGGGQKGCRAGGRKVSDETLGLTPPEYWVVGTLGRHDGTHLPTKRRVQLDKLLKARHPRPPVKVLGATRYDRCRCRQAQQAYGDPHRQGAPGSEGMVGGVLLGRSAGRGSAAISIAYPHAYFVNF
jgi:hypothetical protein